MSVNFSRNMNRRRFMSASAAGLVGAAAINLTGCSEKEEEKQLNVYNWDTYIGEKTLESFTEKTGIKVKYDLFADNEELFAKLKEGNPGFDIIFPSDYMVETMITTDIITALDHSKIPNIKNIDKNFHNLAFNPGMKFGVPYMWGTVGLGYRPSKTGGVPDSWGTVFDPDQASKLSGRIALLADQRSVIGVALKYLGYPLNSVDSKQIDEARDLVIAAKMHIKTFAADNGQDLLASGEVDVAMEWNGDIVQVMGEDKDLSYVVPKEGSVVWTDNICIPKGAPHPENAYAFINHIHDATVNAEIANTIHYATANAAAKPMLLAEDLSNPAVYPPESVVSICESIIDVGDSARLYDEAWTAIQAA
ncbi:MAG: spermidine/putrescine ABC transporter substrate-binding protein [Rhodospirillales bacterium]|nr:spermidine/putrescine ABC transporter substrate-binding protein [Rhodospirillales bacterium]